MVEGSMLGLPHLPASLHSAFPLSTRGEGASKRVERETGVRLIQRAFNEIYLMALSGVFSLLSQSHVCVLSAVKWFYPKI
jgi:hypothetical protein